MYTPFLVKGILGPAAPSKAVGRIDSRSRNVSGRSTATHCDRNGPTDARQHRRTWTIDLFDALSGLLKNKPIKT